MRSIMDVVTLFESQRTERNGPHWGLAWFLAWQFCRRFYASHGIVPHVLAHEGLGYYGIQLDTVCCRVNGPIEHTFGRMACAGDVENWRTGSPGDHGLDTERQYDEGVPTDELITQAIRHLDFPTRPATSHLACRHKRWGASYVLMFEIATIIALRARDGLSIWNHQYHTERHIRTLDPQYAMSEHPGAFFFTADGREVIVAGDGRMLDGSGDNLWEAYMRGASAFALALRLEERIMDHR